MTEAEIKKAILNKLMFVDHVTYGDLHKSFADQHDLFNYHLRELVTKGVVNKTEQGYSLTTVGKQQVALMEEDGQYQKQFKVGMFINVLREQSGNWQMLLHRRKKHPHYDYVGAVTGKLQWGKSLKDNIVRELDEELKIVPTDFTVTGIHREMFHNEAGEIMADGVFFVVIVTKWEGVPAERSVEGEYFWHNIDNILNLDRIFRRGFEAGIPHIKRYLTNPSAYTPFIFEDGEDKLAF